MKVFDFITGHNITFLPFLKIARNWKQNDSFKWNVLSVEHISNLFWLFYGFGATLRKMIIN